MADEAKKTDDAKLADKLAADLKAAGAKEADKPQFDGKTLELLDKLCAHFGVPHTGDVAETTKALGELTGHAGLSPEALIHELADLSGHR